MSTLVQRRDATQATLDRFKGLPFKWGEADCAQLVLAHLRNLGVEVDVSAFPSYTTERGSLRALRRAGYTDLEKVVDDRLDRLASPNRALVGDVVGFRIVGGPLSLSVALGNGRILGFHQETGQCGVWQPLYGGMVATAWRALRRAD